MKKNKKILVVDDEADILKTLKYLLLSEGYEVDTAQTADECISKVKKFQPNLILLDLVFPGKSGFQIAKEIIAIDKNLPIIILSCMTEESSKIFAEQKGAIEYFEKPIDTEKLLKTIKNIFSGIKV